MLTKNKNGNIKDTQENRKKLHKKAWEAFSIYIRKRDKATCVTCGAKNWDSELGEWSIKGFNAGHFWHNVLDFDEENINCQCIRCNHHLSGNLAPYSVYLIKKLGHKRFAELEKRSKLALRGELKSVEDYKKIIDKYK